MQKLIIGVVLLAVGFFGGYLASGNSLSDDHAAIEHSESDEHAMSHETIVEVPAGTSAPTVGLEVTQDPSGSWNARITTNNFRFAPEHVSLENVMGEGHAHIYVDGVKVNRVYGNWYHLGALSEGEHEVSVSLNANDHSSYAVDGEKITDVVTVTVEPKAAFDASNAQMVEMTIQDRTLTPQTVTVTEGDSVHLKVATDEAGEFHIAGYELVTEMNSGGTTDIMFVADKAGRYAIELHPEGEGHMEMEGAMDHDATMEDIEIGSLVVNPQ